MIGEIKEGFVLRNFVGEGTLKNKTTGEKISFELSTAIVQNPIVKYGNKYFTISWQDIVELAKEAGLFGDDVLVDDEITEEEEGAEDDVKET